MSPKSFAFFDLDDTLVDTRTALSSWAADFVREHDLGDETVAAELVARRTEASANWIEFTGQLREWYGITADPRELYERMLVEYTAKFTLDPRTAAGLERLRKDGWLLGIVTNGVARMQDAKVDRAGLRDHVDVVVASEAVGYDKPDVRIFEAAAAALGVTLSRAGWMVGDMYDKDILGGVAAGLRTVWLPHGAVLPERAPRPDHVSDSVAEAIGLVAASAE
jgi:HAD superfamily hydrolase (TIGR01509 family)